MGFDLPWASRQVKRVDQSVGNNNLVVSVLGGLKKIIAQLNLLELLFERRRLKWNPVVRQRVICVICL